MAAAVVAVLEYLRSHVLAVVVCVLLLYLLPKLLSFLHQQWLLYWAFKPIPCNPDQHFLFGHAPKILEDYAANMDRQYELMTANGWKSWKVNLGPGIRGLTVAHPDLTKIVLKNDPKADELYYPFIPWLGKFKAVSTGDKVVSLGRGIFIVNGSRWARSRRLLTPAFHYDILRPYMKVYGEAASELVGLWSKIPQGEAFNAFPYISHLTLDVILRCVCSHKSNCQQSRSPYISAVHILSDLTQKRAMTFHQMFDLIYYCCPDYWKYRKNCKIVHEFAMNIIRQRRKELEESKNSGEARPTRKYLDFIDILLESKDESDVGLTDLQIRAEVDTFVFGGHDTTASALSWTLYNLALHPEHQEICRKEVDEIFAHKDSIELDDLKSLKHIKCCLKESLRLFPPAPIVGRALAQPTEIDGFKMPKGTTVIANIWSVHHHPDFWENPFDFDPLRFTPGRSKGRHSHAFIPFSAGARNCIGQEFALNVERVLLANILRHFEISLDESKLPVQKEHAITIRPKGGLFLKLKRRCD